MKRFIVVLAILLVAPLAFAQQHRQAVHPVPPPTVASANADEHAAKEDEEPRSDFKLWDTQLLNNKQPPFAALLLNFIILALIYYRYGKKPIADALVQRKHEIANRIEDAQKCSARRSSARSGTRASSKKSPKTRRRRSKVSSARVRAKRRVSCSPPTRKRLASRATRSSSSSKKESRRRSICSARRWRRRRKKPRSSCERT